MKIMYFSEMMMLLSIALVIVLNPCQACTKYKTGRKAGRGEVTAENLLQVNGFKPWDVPSDFVTVHQDIKTFVSYQYHYFYFK